MNIRFSLAPIAIAASLAAPTAAFAGAWTLKAGEGIAITTLTPSQAGEGFDSNGKTFPIPRYTKVELQSLLEYGATDYITVMATPSLQHVDIAPPFSGSRTGLGYTDLGARVRLLQGESWVVSAQTTVRLPGTFDKFNNAAIGYTDPELDVRGLVGYSFKAGSWPAFVDVQVAQRFRFGGPPDEFRADVTLGVAPHQRWLILAQSFNVMSEGRGTWGLPSFGYYKAQLSAVYAVTPAVSIQFGGFTTYHGRNALQENGLVLAAWYKF